MKHKALEQTVRYWVGQNKQGRYMLKRAGKRFSLTRGRGHDRRIHEVLQESSHSSMYKVYDNVINAKKKGKLRCCKLLMLDYVVRDYSLSTLPDFSLLIVYFSCRLKISHDSHEFILEFGTVMNTSEYLKVKKIKNLSIN